MWRPGQLPALQEQLKAHGFEPATLWSGRAGAARAAVRLNGCSASFVAPKGLVVTNYHCAYRAVADASEGNPRRDGFYAATLESEMRAEGYRASVLVEVRDVTKQLRTALGEAARDLVAAKALDEAEHKLIDACEAELDGRRCELTYENRGAVFELHVFDEYEDVRLVWAPPESVGDYGGEVDNWMWPRHSADAAFFRVYGNDAGRPAKPSSSNKPIGSPAHLSISTNGISEGQGLAVVGFPKQTSRWLVAAEADAVAERELPLTVAWLGAWVAVLERYRAGDAERDDRLASLTKGFANRHKNAQGMLRGFSRRDIVKKRRAEWSKLVAWSEKKGERKPLLAFETVGNQHKERAARYLLLDLAERGPASLAIAVHSVRMAREADKKDAERAPAYQDRNRTRLEETLGRLRKRLDAEVDGELLAHWLHWAEVESDVAVWKRVAVDTKAAGLDGAKAYVDGATLLADSDLIADERRLSRLVKKGAEAVEKEREPLLELANSIVDELDRRKAEEARQRVEIVRAAPTLASAYAATRGEPLSGDATASLRISLARVGGYAPRDGLTALARTTLAGAVDKHVGAEPFDLPEKFRSAAGAAPTTYWSDPDLGDVVTCFLTDADTTGGNSGSAVVDGSGKLVGLNFDRVWENIVGDYAYSVQRSRNIVVDIRYVLWLLDRVDDAGPLLAELGVADFRSKTARPSPVPTGAPSAQGSAAAPAGSASTPGDSSSPDACACRLPSASRGGSRGIGIVLFLVGALVGRRRLRAAT